MLQPAESIIEAKQLCFEYGQVRVINQIDFQVRQGSFAVLIGSNGSGKSTLLKILLGELTATSGIVRIMGQDTTSFRDWSKIGYVAQNRASSYGGFPATVEEVVQAHLYNQIGFLKFTRKKHHEKVKKSLELVGMDRCIRRPIGELSGGQQQRVLLARALVNDPSLLLLDEPVSGVDAQSARDYYRMMANLNQEMGLSVLMVTHDISKVTNYVTQTFCLEEGSLVELDRQQVEQELKHRHTHPSEGCPALNDGEDD